MANLFPGRRPSSVVELQAGDASRPSVHLVPGGGGQVAALVPLARALGSAQPVRALASPAAGPRAERFTSADRLALRHVADLQRAAGASPGPYRLVGVGTGSIIAFEVARLLRREGVDVDLLVAVDGGPGHLGPDHERPPRPRPWAAGHAAALARRRQWELTVGRWSPQPYDGPMHLLWAAGTPSLGPTQGWGPWVTAVEVQRLSVVHDDLLKAPGLGPLAAALQPLLDASEVGPAAPVVGSPAGTTPA